MPEKEFQGKEIHQSARGGQIFFISFALIFGILFLTVIGLNALTSKSQSKSSGSDLTTEAQTSIHIPAPYPEEPIRVVIESVGIDAPILNPQSRDVSVLDGALKNGAVHYPGSGLLGEETTMFLFGHSTNWEVVQNPAYQSFNGLEKVKRGDLVRVYSGEREYIYEARSVTLVDADEAWVKLSNDKKLFISTCNTFGKKTERFVVEGDFVVSYPQS